MGPVPPPAGATILLTGVHVEPQGVSQDLRGSASFGGIWLGQLPTIVLTAQATEGKSRQPDQSADGQSDNRPVPLRNVDDASFPVFFRGQSIEVACVVSGFATPDYQTCLQLLNRDGRTLAEHRQDPVAARAAKNGATPDRPADRSHAPAARRKGATYDSQVPHGNKAKKPLTSSGNGDTWRLPVDALGFYRVRATVVSLGASGATPTEAHLNFVVVEPQTLRPGSEFGWSLRPEDVGVGLAPLGELLCQSGVRWVKFPFAIHLAKAAASDRRAGGGGQRPEGRAPKAEGSVMHLAKAAAGDGSRPATNSPSQDTSDRSIEALVNFSDLLNSEGMSMVGLLQPPQVNGDNGLARYPLLAAEVFSRDPSTWYGSIEPILSRLATQIRFWQIGEDRDSGWVGNKEMPEIVTRTKGQLDQIGQDLQIGIAWNLAEPFPLVKGSPAQRRDVAPQRQRASGAVTAHGC